MPYRKQGYELHYLRDYTPRPYKTWEQLDLEEEANREPPSVLAKREAKLHAEREADEKRMTDARAARTAMLEACDYKPEPSPEPEWVDAP